MSESTRTLRTYCAAIILAALAFVVADSIMRMRTIHAVTDFRFASTKALVEDSRTPSGYEGNQHNVVVPSVDADHWLMQTQQMASGGGARVRWVDYDGPPRGRAVHWSSLLRWFAVIPAWVDSQLTHRTVAQSAERVYPWVNTACLCILMIALVPIGLRRFGWLPTALLVLGLVTVFPFYDGYTVGTFDHHGLASTCALLTVLFLMAGGGGWVRAESTTEKQLHAAQPGVADWLSTHAGARSWFIASGVAGGAGLWISAATEVPALIGVGLGAFLAVGVLGRAADKNAPWHIEPRLWRTWGIAGALSSLAFYALEYFPSHIGLRLEVNHPLYALAWFGAGDLMCRLGGPQRLPTEPPRANAAWIGLDYVMIGLLPAIIVLVPATFVIRPGTLLLNLHEDYIMEFEGLSAQLAVWDWMQIAVGAGLLALLVVGPAIALSCARSVARPLRALAIVALMPAFVFTLLTFYQVRWLGVACALWLAVLVAVTTAVTLGRVPWRAAVAKSVAAGILALSLCGAFVYVTLRHFEITAKDLPSGAVLAVIAAAIVFPTLGVLYRWTTARLVFAGVALALAFLPAPAIAFQQWRAGDWSYPTKVTDLWQLATRDVSQTLRAHLGSIRGTIVSAPTTSTWMTYFGGFKSLGTLYWENVEGITATASILGATPTRDRSAADSARKLIDAYGVTHLVFFSWNPFDVEYARLAAGIRAPREPTDDAADQAAVKEAFVMQLLNERRIPSWLRPLPYQLPSYPALQHDWVRVFEVVPEQTADEAMVRIAQYHIALNEKPQALQALNAVLELRPGYLPALIQSARLQHGDGRVTEFDATMRRIRANTADADALKFEDELNLAAVYALAGDTARVRSVFVHALAGAHEGDLRRLPPDDSFYDFIQFGRQLNVADTRPELFQLALKLATPAVQARLAGK